MPLNFSKILFNFAKFHKNFTIRLHKKKKNFASTTPFQPQKQDPILGQEIWIEENATSPKIKVRVWWACLTHILVVLDKVLISLSNSIQEFKRKIFLVCQENDNR